MSQVITPTISYLEVRLNNPLILTILSNFLGHPSRPFWCFLWTKHVLPAFLGWAFRVTKVTIWGGHCRLILRKKIPKTRRVKHPFQINGWKMAKTRILLELNMIWTKLPWNYYVPAVNLQGVVHLWGGLGERLFLHGDVFEVVVSNIFLFLPVPVEMIQFDWYVSNGLKPPTSFGGLGKDFYIVIVW